MVGVRTWTPSKGGDFIVNIFDGVIDMADLDISGTVKAAEKSMQQCKEMYDHDILRLRGELLWHKKERNNVASKLEIVTLAAAKSEVERDAAAYKEDAATSHTMVRDISLAAEQKLIRAVEHSKAEAKREILECRDSFRSEVENPEGGGETAGPRVKEYRKEERCPRAFDRLKAELLYCEAPLWGARDREKSLRLFCAAKESELISLQCEVDQNRAREALLEKQLKNNTDELEQLWGEVGKAKREFIKLQAHVNAHSEAKERAQAGASTLEAQIQATSANDSARVKMIMRLLSELSRTKTELVNVPAEIVMNNTRTGQKMAAYSRSIAAAKAKLQKTLDHANNSKEYVRCRSRREILEEIHARGFDLLGEIKQAKREEYDAKFLLSDAEDHEEETARL
ncbi:protein WEAK CHLOROPLAST MOVEMENT UNDER BLUE LIGHT-like 1 [Nicotiana sylvestris]|uniref:protein WEAK CHLOROPLAST MOVEMENT UNDER BLUE LIGHT-like 1 n=1 Tax=Nicotiana sylvestris TaxID=4096 RepID=UPI00388CE467